ncbi:MAG: glycosyl hydrolase family 18 protein [Pseudoflavonifractor sp.]
MVIHVVAPGDSVYAIARRYGVPISQIVVDNELTDPNRLAVGQALVVQFPRQVHIVQRGDTLSALAAANGLSLRQLYRNNPILGGEPLLYPGQTLVLSYWQEKEGAMGVSGYAYPYIDKDLLQATLPYLSALIPFTYGITPTGDLVALDDAVLLAMAQSAGTGALMHLSTLTEEGNFSNDLAHTVLTDPQVQAALINHVASTMEEKGYAGLDVDFEFVFPEDTAAYAAFIGALADRLHPRPVLVALAPKTYAKQPGLLYEAHDYAALGAAADGVLLMTYEWGYTYGPPMAVAPLPNVQRVLNYALTEIPAEKIWLGIPNYGYDWTLPFVKGSSKAVSLSSQKAVALALEYGAEIFYDAYAQSPYFHYTDENARVHEVWFEDARSISAKLALIPSHGLAGAGYWNLMRKFPQNWRVLNALYEIRETSMA